jgi:UDP-2-acetamido-3-amino-2,3-dideoxy-glucuronate N-acetyltransferase
VPGKQIGWMSEFGEQLDLPVRGEGVAECGHSGLKYILSNNKVVKA